MTIPEQFDDAEGQALLTLQVACSQTLLLPLEFCRQSLALKKSGRKENPSKVNETSGLNCFPNKPLFLCVCSTSLRKTLGKGEITRNEQFLFFPQFSNLLDNLLPFSSNLKLLSANSFSLEEFKICHLGKSKCQFNTVTCFIRQKTLNLSILRALAQTHLYNSPKRQILDDMHSTTYR